MTRPAPVTVTWTGEAFEPSSPFHLRRARETYGAGEVVTIVPANDRSMASHNHQFAEIAEMWRTLPEKLEAMPYAKSPDTLRKHALIVTGYADVETVDAGSKAAAERVGAMLSRHATAACGYAIVQVNGPVVRCWTPHSQSMRAMGKETFQASKTAVLEWIGALLAGSEPAREDAA